MRQSQGQEISINRQHLICYAQGPDLSFQGSLFHVPNGSHEESRKTEALESAARQKGGGEERMTISSPPLFHYS